MDVKGWDVVPMDGARDERRQLFIISGHYQAEGEWLLWELHFNKCVVLTLKPGPC